jgi:hypothetical protein
MSLFDPNPDLDYTLDPGTPGPIPSPPRTEKQIEASRLNGAKSHGPVTPEGKAISSKNNLRHGMLAKAILIEGESLDLFHQFIQSLEATWQPVGRIEDAFVETMALSQWRQMRLVGMQKAGIENEISRQPELDPATRAFLAFTTMTAQSRVLDLMNRYESRLDRQYDRALARLLAAQKRRKES